VSIIDDVRIKQDIDKDGKYVCDLNQKEELKVRPGVWRTHSSEPAFVWSEKGIVIKDTDMDVVDPAWFMDATIKWFRYSKDYKWKFNWGTSQEEYIKRIIKKLEELI